MSRVTVYCDGACLPRNGNGWATWGWVAYVDDIEIASDKGCVGQGTDMTNNVAEYYGMYNALVWLEGQDYAVKGIYTDSMLVMSQLNRSAVCHSPRLEPLWRECLRLTSSQDVAIAWIPGEKNTRADELTQMAYQEKTGRMSPRVEKAKLLGILECVQKIDQTERHIKDWDRGFIEDNLENPPYVFSDKQRGQILRMDREYLQIRERGVQLVWEE